MAALDDDQLPEGFDLEAVIVMCAAATNYLLVRSRKIRLFGGITIRTDEGWARLEAAMVRLIHGAFSG